ncbi:MAG: alpha/beta hydrolase [Cyanobacteria bacterium SID2]|nr:alpha/beta hydrolase [Cyanobacteria bacterium SID2]MBP0002261.1 alpha/beta hydrolase [Cyanobacteria bacterium SBC]
MVVRQTLSLSDLELSYLEWGSPSGEPVLLLHGLADHAGVWAKCGEYLASDYHVVAPDLRGHGESGKPQTGYRSIDIIRDLQALMQHLGWTDAHVIGHSWTGKVVPKWATLYPEQFRTAILVDPFFIGKIPEWFRFTFPLLYQVLPFLKGMGPFATHEDAVDRAKTLKQYRGWSDFQKQVFEESIEQKQDGTWGSKFTVEARDGVFEDVMLVAGLTQEIHIPTLFVKPKGGLNRTSFQLKPYRRYLQKLEIQEVPGNHWAFLVEPNTFNVEILEFLKQH